MDGPAILMPYTHAVTGETIETTWDRHPADGDKARVWRRDDDAQTDFPWFYWLPFGSLGSIARTWAEAMSKINDAFGLQNTYSRKAQ